jgi:hypothetical protein
VNDNLRGRIARRTRWSRARLRPVRVRAGGPDAVRVRRFPGRFQRHRLDTAHSWYALRGGTLRLVLPDPAALARLAAAGLLTGEVRRLEVRLANAPDWLLNGVRPAALARTCRSFRWRRRRRSLTVGLIWSRPQPVSRVMADVLAAVLRARSWDQLSGPVFGLDRAAWLSGGTSWPQGRLMTGPAEPERDPAGRPLGPYLPPEEPGAARPAPVVTAVANPYGRRLVGAAARYRLAGAELRDPAGRVVARLDSGGAPETASLSVTKYAVVTVDSLVTGDPRFAGALRGLGACGVVFAAADPAVRSTLRTLDLVTVDNVDEVSDLRGYGLSVAAARQGAIRGDAALRRTTLAGDGAVPLPAVSVLLASMRSAHIETCLGYLASQDYPALEILVGLHGYDAPPQVRERWGERLPYPLRVMPFDAGRPFGAILGELSRAADGELVTKVDDDDHYGRHHVTDLVVAWYTSGAALVGKGARFVHLPERDETVDRTWTAPEVFNVTPAGGTMLLSRGTLAEVGGWSHSSKHVDTDLLDRIRSAGGLVYRTHAMEYVYVRRGSGHTFETETERLLAQAGQAYRGLPDHIIRPEVR